MKRLFTFKKYFKDQFSLKIARGLLYIQADKMIQAQAYLEKIHESIPVTGRLEIEELLARVYLQSIQPAQALELIKDRNSLSLLKAGVLVALKPYLEAEVIYREEFAKPPTSINAKQLTFYLIAQNKIDDALKIIAQAAKFENCQGWIALARASLAFAENKYETVAKFLAIAKEDKGLNSQVLYLESELYFAQGRLFQALNNLNDLSLLIPKDYRVYHFKGRCYLQQNKFSEALSNIE
ncbi:MAG: hypothetical protein MK132_02560 [Lentisphaerales bacterium]|nr:hypothetical protein [Lentisphaerales bacterium]